MKEVMVLTYSRVRNIFSWCRGWTLGSHSALVLAVDSYQRKFYCTFDVRASDFGDATAKISKCLENEGALLLEVEEWFQPSCFIPPDQLIVQIGGRVYFSETEEDIEE